MPPSMRLNVAVLLLATLARAAPVNNHDSPLARVKRSEEMVMFGNHQNLPKVKKADPAMSPLSPYRAMNTDEDEDEEQHQKAVDKIFSHDDSDDVKADDIKEETKVKEDEAVNQVHDESTAAIEKMFAHDDTEDELAAPIAEDMVHTDVKQGQDEKQEDGGDEEEEETSGEVGQAPYREYPDSYYYGYNDYYYPEVDWMRANSRQTRSAGKPAAVVAEDMVANDDKRRSKRDLTDDQIRELLEAGGYGGEEYYNYAPAPYSEPLVEMPVDDAPQEQSVVSDVAEQESLDPESMLWQDDQEDYRDYLDSIMDRAAMEARAEEEAEELALQEARAEYKEYLVEKEQEMEEEEETERTLKLLRVMYENLPDTEEVVEQQEQEQRQPVLGIEEEFEPGYKLEQKWKQYYPSGASVEQESMLTDFEPIVHDGQEGIFIPVQTKRQWSAMTAMPGMRKRGWVGYADDNDTVRQSKRNYEMYGRLYRLARALKGQQPQQFYPDY